MQRTIDLFLRDIALVLSVGGAVMLLVLLVVQWFVVRGLRRQGRLVDLLQRMRADQPKQIFRYKPENCFVDACQTCHLPPDNACHRVESTRQVLHLVARANCRYL